MHTLVSANTRRLVGCAALLAAGVLIAQVALGAAVAGASSNRMSCPEIKGTEYLSDEERDWYWAHCIRGAAAPAPAAAASAAEPGSSVVDQFIDGYRWAGGPEHLLPHLLNHVIPCESRYNVYAVNRRGPYYGLLQFSPVTWQRAGGGDWFSAWQQGANAARLVRLANPATQWPHCWYA